MLRLPLIGATVVIICCSRYAFGILTDYINICDATPCVCDPYARLTCDCGNEPEELLLSSEGERRLSPHTTRIRIKNCPRVVIANSSLTAMGGLRAMDIENVANLTLNPESFELSTTREITTKISLTNCTVDVLPSFAFKGYVSEIYLRDVNVRRINAFAFSNLLGTDALTLINCHVEAMEAQAFKKFDVGFLHVIGGSFGDVVPSRVMNDIEVASKFMLDGVRMGTVRSFAFIIRRPKTVAIQNCEFGTIEGQAFSMTTGGPVIMKNNNFGTVSVGAFLDIRLDPELKFPRLNDVIFKNNSVARFEEGSVMFDRSSFRLELDNVLINDACDCDKMATWRGNLLNYSNVYTRVYGMTLPDEPINVGPETFACLDEDSYGVPVTFVYYEGRNCAYGNSPILLALVVVGSSLALFIGGFLIVWFCRRQRDRNRKRWISVPTNAPDVVVSKKNGLVDRDGGRNGDIAGTGRTPLDSRITMVVPDGRVYRETEFHVIVEKAEPLTTEL